MDGVVYMNMSTPVAANTPAVITVPIQREMTLPADGIDAADPQITVSAAAADGDIPETAIQNVQPVGSFRNSTVLTFSPAKAGAVTTISFR